MKDQGTEPTLRRVIIEYAHRRGGKTMGEIVDRSRRRGCLRLLTQLMDKMWRRFMEGMIPVEVAKSMGEIVDRVVGGEVA